MVPRILSVQTGKVVPLGPDAVDSAIGKTARAGSIAVGPLGLDGDEQADLQSHGGPYKAVYGYGIDHYPDWASRFPQLNFSNGAMGENLSITTMTEKDICAGDIHAIGTA